MQVKGGALFAHQRLDKIRQFHQKRRPKTATLYNLEARRLQQIPVGLQGVTIADVPANRFVFTNSTFVRRMLGVRATDVEDPTFAKQFVKILHYQIVPRNMLESLRTDNLVKFPIELRQIVKIQDFKFQAIRIGTQKGEVLNVFSDLGGFHRDAQDAVAAPVGGIGQGAVTAT